MALGRGHPDRGRLLLRGRDMLTLGRFYTWRISAEEKLLQHAFGEEYVDYRRHTKRLVPFLY